MSEETRWLWRLRVYSRAILIAVTIAWLGTLVLGRNLVMPKGNPLGGDYLAFYAAGSLIAEGKGDRLYDWDEFRRAQARALGRTELPAYHASVYPPFVALAFTPLAWLPYLPSYIVFTLLMALSVWTTVRLLGQIFTPLAKEPLTSFAVVICFYPLLRTVVGGQNTPLTLLLASGALVAFAKEKDFRAGIFLGLMLYKPQFAVPLIGLVAIGGRSRALLSFGLVALVLFLMGVAVLGWDWPRTWLGAVTSWSPIEGQVNASKLISLIEVTKALFGSSSASFLAGALLSALGCIYLVFLFARRRNDLVACLAFACALVLLVSPHTQFYELGLIVIPGALLAHRFKRAGWPHLLALWLAPAILDALFRAPAVQPLFFVAIYAAGLALKPLYCRNAQGE